VGSFHSGYRWQVTVRNIGDAPAERVHIAIRGPNSPVDWVNTSSGCIVTQGIAALSGPNRAHCDRSSLEPGDEWYVAIFGVSSAVVDSGNRTITAEVSDNWPNNPTTTESASFSYAVNPD
jgi:hypothetical protein